MKKKIFALLTALCMTAAVLPAVFADGEEGDLTIGSTQEQCSCVVLCTEDNTNPDCPVCSAEGAELDKVCVGAALLLTAPTLRTGEIKLFIGGQQITESGCYENQNGTWKKVDGTEPANGQFSYDAATATLTLNQAKIVNNQDVTVGGGFTYHGSVIAFSQTADVSLKIVVSQGTSTITGKGGIRVESTTGNASLSIKGPGSLDVEPKGSNSGITLCSSKNTNLDIDGADVTASSPALYGVYLISSTDASSTSTITVNNGSLTTGGNGNVGIYYYWSGTNNAGTSSLTVSGNAVVDTRNSQIMAQNKETVVQVGAGSDGNGGIVFNGKSGTVYGDVTLQEDLEIGTDESLTIGKDASLTVPDGTTLTNNGTINVESGGKLEGKTTGQGTLKIAPAITTQPTSQTVTEGETATFNVEATGTDLTYQWQQKTDGGAWSDISGANSETYTIETTTMDMSGTQYRCVVENSIDEVTSDAATLTVQQAGVPIPPQPTDPTTPETTAPTDTDHTVQTDNSGHAPVEDNTALPSFWELVTERINATPRGGEITINMGARAVPDSVLNALRARSLTATFRYGDTELTLTPDQLPPEGMLTEWTLHELGNYVTEADESIRISEEKSEAENQATAAETAPAADTGKPNPATGETTTTAAALLVAVVALTVLGVTLKKK